MVTKVIGLVIHHGRNGAYYVWHSPNSPDVIVDEKFCPQEMDLLAKWVEVVVDNLGRACQPVTLIPAKYESAVNNNSVNSGQRFENSSSGGYDTGAHRFGCQNSDKFHQNTRRRSPSFERDYEACPQSREDRQMGEQRSHSQRVQNSNHDYDKYNQREEGGDRYSRRGSQSGSYRQQTPEYGFESYRHSPQSPDQIRNFAQNIQEKSPSSINNLIPLNESHSRNEIQPVLRNERFKNSGSYEQETIDHSEHHLPYNQSRSQNLSKCRPSSSSSLSEISSLKGSQQYEQTKLLSKQNEIEVLKSKLSQIQRLFGFFTQNESLSFDMKLRGLEEFEDLESILESINTIKSAK
ncbi:hypothetical protein CAEBREN_05404 [Caenorhabditis brenneri]|uniref:Uncharacterized protein n=1 Tax=Caenorhabditis brenneri TaxID=135651 RepID=G0NYI0_CAEBE|nr:hypothetical protein CAEBREN_05404 [Caenorhabditis brenneri]